MKEIENQEIEQVLRDWYKRSWRHQHAHYEAAIYYAKWNYIIGIPLVVLSAFVGSAIFATLEKEVTLRIRILIGSVSIVSAVLAGLQTFLRFSDRAGKHRSMSAQFGAIRRTIQQILLFSSTSEELKPLVENLKVEIDNLELEAPEIPDRIWVRSKNRVGNRSFRDSTDYPKF
jgi:hypothetical protein